MREIQKCKKLFRSKVFLVGVWISASALAVLAQVTVFKSNVKHPLPEEPLQFVTDSANAATGKLLYMASVHLDTQPGRQHFFVIRNIGQTPQNPDETYQVRIPLDLPELVYQPQFSADGKSVLFKVGWPYDKGGYQPYLWHLESKQLQPLPIKNLVYQKLIFSPDSKYLAYWRGGNQEGDEEAWRPALELHVYNLQTKKDFAIASGSAVKTVAWTTSGTLLFSFTEHSNSDKPEEVKANSATTSSQQSKPTYVGSEDQPPHANIMEIELGQTPKILVSNGWAPVPAPDNQRIAYLSSSDPENTQPPFSQSLSTVGLRSATLCVYDRLTKKSLHLKTLPHLVYDYAWTPDSQRLILLEKPVAQSLITVDGQKKAEGRAKVFLLDLKTGQEKHLASLTGVDVIPSSRPEKQFQCWGISHNGKNLFVSVRESIAKEKGQINYQNSFHAIDLKTGGMTLIAKINNLRGRSLGFDWFDTSEVTTAKAGK